MRWFSFGNRTDKRRSERKRHELSTSVEGRGGLAGVDICDYSSSGLRIRTQAPLQRGDVLAA